MRRRRSPPGRSPPRPQEGCPPLLGSLAQPGRQECQTLLVPVLQLAPALQLAWGQPKGSKLQLQGLLLEEQPLALSGPEQVLLWMLLPLLQEQELLSSAVELRYLPGPMPEVRPPKLGHLKQEKARKPLLPWQEELLLRREEPGQQEVEALPAAAAELEAAAAVEVVAKSAAGEPAAVEKPAVAAAAAAAEREEAVAGQSGVAEIEVAGPALAAPGPETGSPDLAEDILRRADILDLELPVAPEVGIHTEGDIPAVAVLAAAAAEDIRCPAPSLGPAEEVRSFEGRSRWEEQ